MRKSPVFIIGYGRSGTHWLSRTLNAQQEIRATIEIQPIFSWVTEMALNPFLQRKLFWRLILRYRVQMILSTPKRYLDKSHPNIWLVEKLLRAFPNAQFVGIERNPYATVASAIKHRGGEKIRKRWRSLPIPNDFLGIDDSLINTYDGLSLAKKYSLSWLSHHNRMDRLRTSLNHSLKVINYESFSLQTEKILIELAKFLGLSSPIPIPQVKAHSLDKWQNQLSTRQILDIEEIVGFSPDKLNS